jgi:hypothetical protein
MPRRKATGPSSEVRKRYLAASPAEHMFWCQDGRVFRDMADLARGLDSMADEVFSYHANDDKNDFANWVRDVIGDQQLAGELSRAHGRIAAAAAVQQRVAFLSQR